MKPFKPSIPVTSLWDRIKDTKIKISTNNYQKLFSDIANDAFTDAILTGTGVMNMNIKPVLVFSNFWPHGEFLRSSDCSSGGKLISCSYLQDCYAYSEDGRWWKMMNPTKPNLKPTWFNIGTNDLPNKEYQVKAMLMKDSF